MPSDDAEAFRFLDPDDIIRGSHLIPAFAHGSELNSRVPSVANNGKQAWNYYYVNWCVTLLQTDRFPGLVC